jgi:Protein of unknown function (DUF3108)
LIMYLLRLGAKRALKASLAPAVFLISCAATPAPAGPAQRSTLPAHVNAVYRISFTALGKIGTFRFKSDIAGEAYALSAEAKINTYIFGYKGQMSSAGAVPAAQAQPANYTYSYKQKALFGTKKVSTLTMAFDPAGVSRVTFVPPEKLSKNAVPVMPAHLKSVLDPLSGVMGLSLGNLAKPCEQRLPIYDGQQRFDVVFAPSGVRPETKGDHVCVVHLQPISGHKKGEGVAAVVNGNIEVVLRPMLKANVIIPLIVTVPTSVGTAVLTSEQVDITMPDQQHISLQR